MHFLRFYRLTTILFDMFCVSVSNSSVQSISLPSQSSKLKNGKSQVLLTKEN